MRERQYVAIETGRSPGRSTCERLLLLLFILGLTAGTVACVQRAEEINFAEVVLGDAKSGEQLIEVYGCPACHIIPGIENANASVGPPLTDWSQRGYIAGTLLNQPTNLVTWIMNPQSVEPGTAMPDMGVTEPEARDIAAYLFTLGDGLNTAPGSPWEQPVAFSHRRHVGDLGLDCRYCHTSVTRTAFAGMPSTHTCMTCHSQVLPNNPLLEPVRISWEQDVPIPWLRLHDLADSVHFDHPAHLRAGVGCDTCHGNVAEMIVTEQVQEMTMSWCLDCHRQPQNYLRPREEVFNIDWQMPADQEALGAELLREYEIPLEILTDCSLCHY